MSFLVHTGSSMSQHLNTIMCFAKLTPTVSNYAHLGCVCIYHPHKPKLLIPITTIFPVLLQMDSILSLFLALAAVLLPLLWGVKVLRLWPNNKKKAPIGATIFHQLFHFENLYDYRTQLSRQHKTFRIINLFNNNICTTDPANVEYILSTNFANYGKGPVNYQNLSTLLGDGIFAVDGDRWKYQRKLASHEFSTRVLRDFSSVVFRTNAIKLCRMLSDKASFDRPFDIQDLLMRSTLDSIFKVGFGVELNVLEGSSEEFARAFMESSTLTTHRFVDPFWKIKKLLNVGTEAALKKNMEVLDSFVYKIISHRDQDITKVEKQDILSRFLVERKKNPELMTEKYLKDIILNFLVAGRDTTAGTLAWFFYMACVHPDVQEKVAEEVTKVTQCKETVTLEELVNHLDKAAIDKMQYLHAALSETLRLYPAVPVDGKYCFSDDVLPDGTVVKKGDIVDYQPYPMGRMEHNWGHEALEFRPERWLDENGRFRPESPFKFTAFQSGPRICLGKEFAYTQMKIFAATLLFFLKFKLNNEKQVVNYHPGLTLVIDGGLHLRAEKRFVTGA